MTGPLTAPVWAAAALLVVAATPKLADPSPLVKALTSVRLPAGRQVVRAFAGFELLVAAAVFTPLSRVAVTAMAGLYAGFSAFVALALARRGVISSCGCLGTPDTPPTRAHLGLTLVVAAAAATGAARPGLLAHPVGAVDWAATLGATALLTFLAWQVLAVLPATTPRAVRSARAPGRSSDAPSPSPVSSGGRS